MQTVILLLLLFLISIFSVLLYLKTKTSRIDKLKAGECPTCGKKTKTFYDETTKTTFKSEVISAKILKGGGCSGVLDIEYLCKACGLKEIHNQ
jgi:hypothetical protein